MHSNPLLASSAHLELLGFLASDSGVVQTDAPDRRRVSLTIPNFQIHQSSQTRRCPTTVLRGGYEMLARFSPLESMLHPGSVLCALNAPRLLREFDSLWTRCKSSKEIELMARDLSTNAPYAEQARDTNPFREINKISERFRSETLA